MTHDLQSLTKTFGVPFRPLFGEPYRMQALKHVGRVAIRI